MKIHRLIVTGFGKLVQREFLVGDGLTVFFGSNESGKSTLQAFIRAMLFGMKDPDAKRRRWQAEHAHYQPWVDVPYGGAMEFSAAGRLYRVERSFSRQNDYAKIFDAVTGRDLTSEYQTDSRRELLYAESFMGMNELVFRGTACIGDIPDFNSDKGKRELAARLANLQESGDEATSVRRAADLLESARRNLVTRLNEAVKEEADAVSAWDQISAYRASVQQIEMWIAQIKAERLVLEEEKRTATLNDLAHDIVQLAQKVEKAEQITAEATSLALTEGELATVANFPVHLHDEVQALAARLEALQAECTAIAEESLAVKVDAQAQQIKLEQLPGAQGILGADKQEPPLLEQAKTLQVRVDELTARVAKSTERLHTALASSAAAEEAAAGFGILRTLPAEAPRLLADILATEKSMHETKRHLLELGSRHDTLRSRMQAYKQKAANAVVVLDKLQAFAHLPAGSERILEQQAANAANTAYKVGEVREQLRILHEHADKLTTDLEPLARLASLPHNADNTVSMLAQHMQSGKQALLVIEPLVAQAGKILSRQEQYENSLTEVTAALAGTEKYAAFTDTDLQRFERELAVWQVAAEQTSEATADRASLQAIVDELQKRLATLAAVAQEGAVALAKAEQMATDVEALRTQAHTAAAAADSVLEPGTTNGWLGALVVLAGLLVGLSGSLLGLPLTVRLAVIAVLCTGGGLLLLQQRQTLHAVATQREQHYKAKSEALSAIERLNAQLRTMLVKVAQPSVAAWDMAWQNLADLQRQLTDAQQKVQAALAREHTAASSCAMAHNTLLPLLRVTSCANPSEVSPAEAMQAVSQLRAQLALRHRLLAEQQSLKQTLESITVELKTVEQAVTTGYKRFFPLEPSHLVYDVVPQLQSRVSEVEAELEALLQQTGVTDVNEFLHAWRTRQLLIQQLHNVHTEQAERQQTFAALEKQLHDQVDQVLSMLTPTGIISSNANIHCDDGMPDCSYIDQLPWSADHLASFAQNMLVYQQTQNLVAQLPLELSALVDDVQHWQQETMLCGRQSDELQAKLLSILRLLPPGDDWSLAAATLSRPLNNESTVAGIEDELAYNLWPDTARMAQQALEHTPLMHTHADFMASLAFTAHAAVDELLAGSGASNMEDFNRLWAQWIQIGNLCKEKQQTAAHCLEMLTADEDQLYRLLQTNVAELLHQVNIPLPEQTPSLASGSTGATILSMWQSALQQAITRVQEVMAEHEYLKQLQQKQCECAASYTQRIEEHEARKHELNQLLTPCGAESVQAFMEMYHQHHQLEVAQQKREANKRELQALLGHNLLSEWQQELACKQAEWAHGTGISVDQIHTLGDKADWVKSLQQVQQQLESLKMTQVQAETELAGHMQACVDEERCAARLQVARKEKATAQTALGALQLAQSELGSAAEEVHRQFAPALNRQASLVLEQFTGGHYHHLTVSDSLEIRLTDPEFHKQVGLDHVSRGTCDQVYLAFRLACVQTIAGNERMVPFLLDDAFAHYDDTRARQGLDALLQLTQETQAQILFFTCRERELAILKQRADELGISCSVDTLM